MTATIERMADRLLGAFAPRVTAKADLCSCTGYRCKWVANCYHCCNGCHWRVARCE
ncbi:hypothetical protein [Streptosporangium sp. NPDC023615]|uniref:hypothetical protein n=1 Tax=Streptosporangium sp. NPDC023615 TaxID=3154794 RepID=UPI003418DD33